MSALRFAHPDTPTRLVDLGPSLARRSHGSHDARPVTNLGDMAPRLVPIPATSPARREQMAAYKERMAIGDRCGAPLPMVGGGCWRRKGHRDSHRSRQAMTVDAQRRRTGDHRGGQVRNVATGRGL